MKKLLNTIYVTTEVAALRNDGKNIVAMYVSPPLPPPPTRRERFRASSVIELCRPDIVERPVRARRSRMVEQSLSGKGSP